MELVRHRNVNSPIDHDNGHVTGACRRRWHHDVAQGVTDGNPILTLLRGVEGRMGADLILRSDHGGMTWRLPNSIEL